MIKRIRRVLVAAVATVAMSQSAIADATRPNIILAMTDDQGFGDVAYNGHPHLKTPNLDAMAASGLRLDHFYAAAPVCSPTRASVLTGRHPYRMNVLLYGYPLRRQEVTIAQILQRAGYATGHFGKWHLNGKAGPGVPVAGDDPRNPGAFGFETWASASNFFDRDDGLSHNGKVVPFTGDSSDATVAEAIKFIRASKESGKPFLAVVWYGSPHVPHRATEADNALYAERPEQNRDFLGEISGVDRSIGTLRKALRDLEIADNTIVWFCSDNGGLKVPAAHNPFRGNKGSLWEGGLRVPAIIEWPARIRQGRRLDQPTVTSDIVPTLLDLLELKSPNPNAPLDGVSLVAAIDGQAFVRGQPVFFQSKSHVAMVEGTMKLHRIGGAQSEHFELYDLAADPKEATDLAAARPEIVERMRKPMEQWLASVERSHRGEDYPEGKLTHPDEGPRRLTPEERNWRQNIGQ